MPDNHPSKLVDSRFLDESGRVNAAKAYGYHAADPTGRKIPLTKELFTALSEFLGNTEKRFGSIQVQFANGGVASVKAERVYK